MCERGFSKFYWGFLLIMLNFRIQGFDLLPDIIGYLFFASGFKDLSSKSPYFITAARFNIPMIILSIFSIYQAPVQGGGIHFSSLGIIGIPIMIASFILDLLVVYNLFAGIKDMANKTAQADIEEEADSKWNIYLILKLASLLAFAVIFIPGLAIFYLIGLLAAAIIIAMHIAGFMKRCSLAMSSYDDLEG